MKTLSKVTFAGLILLLLATRSFSAPSEMGVLSQISGKVEVVGQAGKTPRVAKDGTKVRESEKVTTAADSKTMVRFFDGSQLAISPNSSVQMSKIQKLSGQDKVLRFKLLVGKLMASVQKLASSKSSFEIEAGGVVCGVRGTQYIVQFDPATGKVNVQVLDGKVWVDANGKIYTFGGGQGGTFTNGNPDNANPNSDQAQGKGGNDFNPFYGFDGNPGDDLNGELTDPTGGMDGIADQASSDGRSGTNSQGLILQLGFPEYAGKNPGVAVGK